ncbi:MAG: FapA family protein, partial [Spirochaetaceae bacterium]|nr:FapA family protein [Spirochaetaceae bacterium]
MREAYGTAGGGPEAGGVAERRAGLVCSSRDGLCLRFFKGFTVNRMGVTERMDTQRQTAQRRIVMARDNPYSAHIVLSFFNGDLEARADFMPPVGAGEPLTLGVIHDFLTKTGVVHGLVHDDAIQKAATQSALEKQTVTDVLIAQGDPPVHEVPPYFELNPRLSGEKRKPAPITRGNRVDHRAHSPFIIVKKNQILARLHPRVAGGNGTTVCGQSIPYKTVPQPGVTAGENTKTDENAILAEINGQFVYEKGAVHVRETLVIKSGVGYATGNILFPGDVVIEGPVSDGFTIHAGGSLTVKQSLDATEVFARGNLRVSGGIIGKNQALVKIRGDITGKFIENCRVACRKTVRIEREIINSTVYAMEYIDLGDKGAIISGDLTAINGIRAGKIGKRAGRSTKLHCGIDFTLQQEQEKANTHFQFLTDRLEKIQSIMAAAKIDHERWLRLDELRRRIEEERARLGEKLSDLLNRANANQDATVEVRGEIAPGTLIEICHKALFVAEPLRNTRIRLDPFYGKLITEPLK